MGSFLQINPNLNNSESDSVYLSDALRVNGIPEDAIFPSLLANKIFYQSSTFIAAFATMMANKSFPINDGGGTTGGFNALVAQLTNVVCKSDLASAIITVPYASSMTFSGASGYYTQLTGNVASASLPSPSLGALTFVIAQDATGNRTFAWPAGLNPAGPICLTANSISLQSFLVLPNGVSPAIIPFGGMWWITSSGVILQPTPQVVQVSTSGTVSSAYAELTEVVNCSAGPVTRSLYSAVGTTGYKINIKRAPGDTSNNPLTVQPLVGGQSIDGFPNFSISAYESICFQSDGANFIII